MEEQFLVGHRCQKRIGLSAQCSITCLPGYSGQHIKTATARCKVVTRHQQEAEL
jgi:hypothetical protein